MGNAAEGPGGCSARGCSARDCSAGGCSAGAPQPLSSRLSPAQRIDLSFSQLTYEVPTSFCSKDKKTILRGVSGEFRSGQLTAVMGPSGAGKTSLLNLLAGSLTEGVGGKVLANGEELDARTRALSAYIPQQDHLSPDLTVQETMLLAANLKLHPRQNLQTKINLIEKVLRSMCLGQTKDTRCCRLSGGERKRLNICLELLDNPPLLFLDEPTSGLDSSNCRLLMEELKALARSERTIICSLHQPSATVFSLLDHLHLLHRGQTVYQGAASHLLPFLQNVGLPCPLFHNPADFVMDVIVGEFGCFTERLVQASESNKWREDASIQSHHKPNNQPKQGGEPQDRSTVKEDRGRGRPSEWARYVYLVHNIATTIHRDWVMTYLKVLMHVTSALSVGVLFFRFGDVAPLAFNNTIYLFMTSVYICFTTVMPATVKFGPQLEVIKREHFNNWYKFKTYFLAFCCVNLPIQVTSSLIFLVISYVMTGQPLEFNRLGLFAISTALETIISDMIGLIMGTLDNAVNGVFVGSIYLSVTFLLGGYFAPLKNLLGFLRFLSYFSFLRYSFELKVIAIYGLGRGKFVCPDEEFYCHVRHPKIVFDFIGLEDGQITRDMTALLGFTAAVTLIAYFRLRHSLKQLH